MSLVDGFGRVARKLRVSVTDRCNLRCTYCMPAQPKWLAKADVLSYEELAALTRAAVARGVTRVRVTGGEPLVRADVARFVRMLKGVAGIEEVALTSNGLLLAEQAAALKSAGLDRVTVSLDSLDPKAYERLTRRPGLERAIIGIEAAEAAGLRVKINVVVMRGVNDGELPGLAEWGRASGRHLRFIEFMPLEGDRIWRRSLLVPAAEIVRRIGARFPLKAVGRESGATERGYRYADGGGSLGVIASVTRAFCGDCDRVRLAVDGDFRTCLFAASGVDLRGPLRAGAREVEIGEMMARAVAGKARGHLIGLPGFAPPKRAMNVIGG